MDVYPYTTTSTLCTQAACGDWTMDPDTWRPYASVAHPATSMTNTMLYLYVHRPTHALNIDNKHSGNS